MSGELAAGSVFVVGYPFVREPRTLSVPDDDGWHEEMIQAWVPGVYGYTDDDAYSDRCVGLCDAVGKQVLTVVSTHKPGRYPERVFYTRHWVEPDGRAFGKPSLRVATREKFLRTCAGYGGHIVRGYRVRPRDKKDAA